MYSHVPPIILQGKLNIHVEMFVKICFGQREFPTLFFYTN